MRTQRICLRRQIESDMVNIEDENFEVVTIESTHQVCVDQWS